MADITKAYENAVTSNTADKIERTGVIKDGNIKLSTRKPVDLGNGFFGTVKSMSFSDRKGVEILIPTIVNGKPVSDKTAIAHYYKTGEHLGIYTSPEAADKAANRIHEAEEKRIKRLGY